MTACYEARAHRQGAPVVTLRVLADDAAHARRLLAMLNYVDAHCVKRIFPFKPTGDLA
jgi:hypothetical protein